MIGDLGAADATALAELVARGEVSPSELLDAALAAVEARNPAINAVVLLQEGVARKSIADGLPPGPFRGVPFLIKDLGCEARDFPSHNGSRLFANTVYPGDSSDLRADQGDGRGDVRAHDLARRGRGAATEAAVYGGPTRNPWNLEHTSGGSSGGAGAAVAAGIVAMAHGSDGGGSVRIPAIGLRAFRVQADAGAAAGRALCRRRLGRHGDRRVPDPVGAGYGGDAGRLRRAGPWRALCCPAPGQRPCGGDQPPAAPVAGGICDTTLTGEAIHPEVAEAVRAAGRLLESLGHVVEPALPQGGCADDDAGLDRYRRRRHRAVDPVGNLGDRPPREDEIEGVGRGAWAYAQTLHPTRYLQAVGEIHRFGRQMARFFDEGPDVLLSATLAEPPAKVGRFSHMRPRIMSAIASGREGIFAYSPFCAIFNASGQPAASLPTGWSQDGLPIGVHLAAAFGQDEELIALCAEVERAAPWAAKRASDGGLGWKESLVLIAAGPDSMIKSPGSGGVRGR
jgi:amidase